MLGKPMTTYSNTLRPTDVRDLCIGVDPGLTALAWQSATSSATLNKVHGRFDLANMQFLLAETVGLFAADAAHPAQTP
jgi:hypothetical protein